MPRLGAALVLLTTCTAIAVRAQGPAAALDRVLARAGVYAATYMDVLSRAVAEEKYVQEVSGRRPDVDPELAKAFGVTSPKASKREMRSDVAMVKLAEPLGWIYYRDVFEVDRKAVRDRDDRVAKLMLQPADTVYAQSRRIADESARFNISAIGRTINEPGLPMLFLQAALQPRFRFALEKRDAGAGEHVWIVTFDEQVRPSLLRHNHTNENPSAGRLWIDATTGAVVRSEHTVSPHGLTATFTTTFRPEPSLGISVPVEMRERVVETTVANGQRLQGVATYTNYRRFDVNTEEKIK